MIEGKQVVVTGGAGFLGSHVVGRLLALDNRVRVLDDFSNGKRWHLSRFEEDDRLRITEGDVAHPGDVDLVMADADVVIHLAVLGLRQSLRAPLAVNRVIVDGTITCLQAARAHDVGLFVNCSSSEVFGSAQYVPMDEEHPHNPETPYAAAKVAQDMYVASYGRSFGLPWTTVRPFNMYGSNSHWEGPRGEVIPKMIVRALGGEPIVVFGDGEQTRDFIHVEDAADALLAVAASESCRGEEVNVGAGREIAIGAVAELVCEHTGLDLEEAIDRQAARPGDVRRHLADTSKLRSLVGFEPTKGFEEGLAETVEWFRSLPFSPEELLSAEVLRAWE
jgi:UDP-glucose 4-epimerase